MSFVADLPRLVVIVGAGGVGKTTVAAATGLLSARAGQDTLVMTFDPSLRLKDALGVGEEARTSGVPVETGTKGSLSAGLLNARHTFDGLIERYAPDDAARDRILGNAFYKQLAGHLGGILEYMAVERLFELDRDEKYQRLVLDTPPTRQALDFLEAPRRIVSFLDSGALQIALKPWFDADGRLRPTARLGGLGRRVDRFMDEIVGMELLRNMAEFFRAFGPLFAGFRRRALEVETLLRSPQTQFVLVSGPGEGRIADTMFFARRLQEAGHHLGPLIVNRVHPLVAVAPGEQRRPAQADGNALLAWMGEQDQAGVQHLRSLLPAGQALAALPLLASEPGDVQALLELGGLLDNALRDSSRV